MKNIMICLEKMDIGGIETSVLNQALEYKRRGIKPIIVASKGIYVDILKENNIDFEEIEFPLGNNINMEKTKKIIEIIEKYNIEQVIINQLPCILSVLPACIIKNIPYVAYVHTASQMIRNDENNVYDWFEKTYPIFKELLKIYFQSAYKIIAISKVAENYVANRYGIEKDKFKIIRNSINLNLYECINRKNQKNNWILISRLSKEKLKAVKNGIDIFDEYDNENKKLTIVGDGNQKEELEEYARVKESKDNITFVGARNDVKDLIDKNDIVLGVDRVILEALAMKKIAIVIGYNEPKEIITKDNIEIASNEGFCGESLKSTNIEDLSKIIKEENIDVEENYKYIKENLNIEKNIYLEESKLCNYELTYGHMWQLIEKLQMEKMKLEEDEISENTEEKNKIKKELIEKEKELELLKEENDKNFQELQSLYNSKRFKIVNKIANIVKPNKNF